MGAKIGLTIIHLMDVMCAVPYNAKITVKEAVAKLE